MSNSTQPKSSHLIPFQMQTLVDSDIVQEIEQDNESAEPQRYLRLRTHDPRQDYVVEAICIICFKDYDVGEQVVWSSSEECRHVYHKDCILKWISTGKRKCPVCRSSFVPDLSPEDTQAQLRRDPAAQTTTNETSLSQGPDAV